MFVGSEVSYLFLISGLIAIRVYGLYELRRELRYLLWLGFVGSSVTSIVLAIVQAIRHVGTYDGVHAGISAHHLYLCCVDVISNLNVCVPSLAFPKHYYVVWVPAVSMVSEYTSEPGSNGSLS